jgi:hypothetical protein
MSSAAAVGGFVVTINGSDFSRVPAAVVVMVGGLPCVVVAPTLDHDALQCVAPPLQVDRGSEVVVTVDGQSSAAWAFTYDPPVVSSVTPLVLNAVPSASRPRLTVRGVNFGTRYRDGLTPNHTVMIGDVACGSLVWVSDSEVSCGVEGDLVTGVFPVSVAVAGVSAPVDVEVTFTCPRGTYGQAGERCAGCPAGAVCPGGTQEPLSLPGFYPVARTSFVACAPVAACTGGAYAAAVLGTVNNTLGCHRHYTGQRCGNCAPGAYRLRGECKGCPNTAWLLFAALPLAVLGGVLVAVYLSKKRINLSGLSLGVVRGC